MLHNRFLPTKDILNNALSIKTDMIPSSKECHGTLAIIQLEPFIIVDSPLCYLTGKRTPSAKKHKQPFTFLNCQEVGLRRSFANPVKPRRSVTKILVRQKFGPGPISSLKILVPWTNFFEKVVWVSKFWSGCFFYQEITLCLE